MAENPNAAPEGITPVLDTYHAPLIFFDGVPTFGRADAVYSLTLSAGRTWVGTSGSVVSDRIVVAYLRCHAKALLNLREAIDKALLLVQKEQELS